MLAPDTRQLLLDALRPPLGSTLDHAVATTFTLDLGNALMVPLALAGFNLSGDPDLIAVMESLRSTAAKLDIFAQAGMVKASTWPGDLSALLESSIHLVHRPRPGHLFHPKLWVIRFVDETQEVSYRTIVTSRNLTSDRSWDVILRLDSDPEVSRRNRDNDGLCHLLSALLGMQGVSSGRGRRERIERMISELRLINWHMPEDCDSVRFLALGVPSGVKQRELAETFNGYKHLAISPFVTNEGLGVVTGGSTASEVALVSRVDQMAGLDRTWLDSISTFAIDPLAGLGGEEEGGGDSNVLSPLGQLHAKVYVIERNRRAYVLVGSANATSAAFQGNVEILCEISGSPRNLGVETMLGEKAPFRGLLQEHLSSDDATADSKADAARVLEAYLVDLAEAELTLTVTRGDGGYQSTLRSAAPLAAAPPSMSMELTVAPFCRLQERSILQPGQSVSIEYGPRVASEISGFFAIRALARIDGQVIDRSTLVKAVVVGDPPERLDEIVMRQLDSPEKFMRFLLLLLSLGGSGGHHGLDASLTSASWAGRQAEGLLELLVRSLAVQPWSLERLSSIIEQFKRSGRGDGILPEGWDEVWAAVDAARETLSPRS